MLKKSAIIFVAMLSLTAASASAGAAPDIKEGLWEITTKTKMTGLPISMPEVKDTQCLTKKDIIPEAAQSSKDCTMTSQKVSGDTVSWEMECKTSEGTTKGSGTITYKGDNFEGTMKMSVPGGMNMTSTMTGKRLGPCK